MLSELEQKIVENCRVPFAGAQQMVILLQAADFQQQLSQGTFPSLDDVQTWHATYRILWSAYDNVYNDRLPQYTTNPLLLEQEAWRLFSPMVRSFYKELKKTDEGISPNGN